VNLDAHPPLETNSQQELAQSHEMKFVFPEHPEMEFHENSYHGIEFFGNGVSFKKRVPFFLVAVSSPGWETLETGRIIDAVGFLRDFHIQQRLFKSSSD
jgi:hypothetical protein